MAAILSRARWVNNAWQTATCAASALCRLQGRIQPHHINNYFPYPEYSRLTWALLSFVILKYNASTVFTAEQLAFRPALYVKIGYGTTEFVLIEVPFPWWPILNPRFLCKPSVRDTTSIMDGERKRFRSSYIAGGNIILQHNRHIDTWTRRQPFHRRYFKMHIDQQNVDF